MNAAVPMTDTPDVHPVAELFPMLGADDLAELAADIAERGLLHPIVLDADGRLLDGRNRLAARQYLGCQRHRILHVPQIRRH